LLAQAQAPQTIVTLALDQWKSGRAEP
jgi:hypothetical protein